ncbi:endonuclease/exonuclease/phosphatase family protein [Streptomyces sp. NPDC051320]|uniref:endonuclease/exonuclease/phosphatase family protein n=1 Tax=Streptomyces sp. NPDC051320 TaxID=3154644 RepID=UPI00343B7522
MTDADGRLRVLTMNVLELRYADGRRRRAALRRTLTELSPDVMALQEVSRREVTDLHEAGWHVAPHPHWSADDVGAVLAARRPFGGIRSTGLRVTERTARTPWCGAVVAELPLPGPLHGALLVHHKPSWPFGYERERELQAVATTRLVEGALAERPVPHVVLMGDFDAAPEASSMRFWRGLQSLEGISVCYQDAWAGLHPDDPGHTFSPRNPLVRQGDMPEEAGRRIDGIMVRCDRYGPTLHIADCRRILVTPTAGTQVSDHYGLVADLTLPDHLPGSWA